MDHVREICSAYDNHNYVPIVSVGNRYFGCFPPEFFLHQVLTIQQENMSVNWYPLIPYSYTVKLGCAGVYLFFLFLIKKYIRYPTMYVLSGKKIMKFLIFFFGKNLYIAWTCFRNVHISNFQFHVSKVSQNKFVLSVLLSYMYGHILIKAACSSNPVLALYLMAFKATSLHTSAGNSILYRVNYWKL